MILSNIALVVDSLYIAAGIVMLVAIQSALIGIAGFRTRKYRQFSFLSFAGVLFLLSTGWYYKSGNVFEAALALKIQVASLCFLIPLLFSFLALYTGQTGYQKWSQALWVFSGTLLVVNLGSEYSLRFLSMARSADILMPWGERLPQFMGEVGPLFRIFRGVALAVLIWGIYRSHILYTQGRRGDGLFLGGSMLLMFFSAVWGHLIDSGIVPSFYLVGYAYLALVLLMSYRLAHELRHSSEAIQANAREFQVAATAFETHEAIMITDASARIIRVNKAFEKMTGYSSAEVIGKNPEFLIADKHDERFHEKVRAALSRTGTWSGELWGCHQSGKIAPRQATITAVCNAEGEVTHYVAIFNDISERKKAEADIHHLAFGDALTGLPNRQLMADRLLAATKQSAQTAEYGALLFVDLDRFKTLNDTLGHVYGDMLITEVAHRIKQCLGPGAIVARFNADEFLVMLERLGRIETDVIKQVEQVAEEIRATLSVPCQLGNYTHHFTASIGVRMFLGEAVPVDDLMKHAGIALYQAKVMGRNQVCFFDPHLQLTLEARAALELDLRQALAKRQFLLHYQVQVDEEGHPVGAEALIRWKHPTRGMVPPSEFIPLAEESTLILDIGQWVLHDACAQLAAWSHQEKTRDLTMAVNISAKQFRNPAFVEQVKAQIDAHRIDPSRLKIELTGVVSENGKNRTLSRLQRP